MAGSVGGKYGARTHFSAHRRLKILHAAQGLKTTGGVGVVVAAGGGGEDDEEGEWERGVDEVVVFVSLHSITALNYVCLCTREREKLEKEREGERGEVGFAEAP